MEIMIKNKYIMYNFYNNKIVKLTNANTKSEINENIKGKKINVESDIILITFEKTDWTSKTKIPINMLGGPIKVLFSFYTISKKGILKKNIQDPRAVQFLFYTNEYYLKHKINSKDLKKLALFAQANKLEKRALAPKLITQLN
jgi:hypothetical protein